MSLINYVNFVKWMQHVQALLLAVNFLHHVVLLFLYFDRRKMNEAFPFAVS